MRRVIVNNTSAAPATIIWKLKKDSALHSPLFISNSETVTFTISNKAPYNIMRLPLGIGSWEHGALQNFVDDLEGLEIKSASINEQLTTEAAIKDFLSQNRRGILKKNIKIYIH